MNGRTVVR